jgi:hypothetical protein
MKRKSPGPDLARRRFLVGIAVVTGCASALMAAAACVTPRARRPTLIGRIRELLERPARHDTQLVALARQVVGGPELDLSRQRWSEARLARAIRANIVADHAMGRIVDEGRWQLSATEAYTLRLMRRLEAAEGRRPEAPSQPLPA